MNIKLHLGCGPVNFGKDWKHIDGGDYVHLDHWKIYPLNLFDNKTVSLIYASHTLEYYEREQVPKVLKEWYRVLKPKGILRLAVPDFRAMVSLYLEGRVSLGLHKEKDEDKPILPPLFGVMEVNNLVDKRWTPTMISHKTVFDAEELRYYLLMAGFKVVREWDCHKTPPHNKFKDGSWSSRCGQSISLNLEAVK